MKALLKVRVFQFVFLALILAGCQNIDVPVAGEDSLLNLAGLDNQIWLIALAEAETATNIRFERSFATHNLQEQQKGPSNGYSAKLLRTHENTENKATAHLIALASKNSVPMISWYVRVPDFNAKTYTIHYQDGRIAKESFLSEAQLLTPQNQDPGGGNGKLNCVDYCYKARETYVRRTRMVEKLIENTIRVTSAAACRALGGSPFTTAAGIFCTIVTQTLVPEEYWRLEKYECLKVSKVCGDAPGHPPKVPKTIVERVYKR